MIIYGTRLFGEVDQVPGVFSVRTRFFHINFLPLIPTASFLMFGPDRGVELSSVQFRSVLASWVRAALLVFGAVLLIIGLISLGNHEEKATAIAELVFAVLCGVGLWGSYRLTRASKDRALTLCGLAGLSDDAKDAVERHFRQASGAADEF